MPSVHITSTCSADVVICSVSATPECSIASERRLEVGSCKIEALPLLSSARWPCSITASAFFGKICTSKLAWCVDIVSSWKWGKLFAGKHCSRKQSTARIDCVNTTKALFRRAKDAAFYSLNALESLQYNVYTLRSAVVLYCAHYPPSTRVHLTSFFSVGVVRFSASRALQFHGLSVSYVRSAIAKCGVHCTAYSESLFAAPNLTPVTCPSTPSMHPFRLLACCEG